MGFVWCIVYPMMRPALLGSWGSYLFPLAMTSSELARTAPVGLRLFRQGFGADCPIVMVAPTLLALPAILVFLAVLRHLIDGLMTAAEC